MNLSGVRSGRLVGMERTENKGKKTIWLCTCDCGQVVHISTGDFRSGHAKSCGCLRKDVMRTKFVTHGLTHEPIYETWKGMKARCLNPKNKEYKNYGGRGVIVALNLLILLHAS